jgi:C-terminal peptidase prc
MEMRDAVDKLMGPPNTKVKFKVWREGLAEPAEYELARQNIRIESVSHQMMDNNVGYIRLSRFSENSTTDMRKAINELKTQGMKSIILDLRFNTGGLLREAIDISDLFLPKGAPIVATKGRLREPEPRRTLAERPPSSRCRSSCSSTGGSASASEILAGALQDNHVAMVMGPAGQNTYGKGSVQTIENLSSSLQDDKNGNARTSALRLTTARYYTPSGRTIHRLGVTPDIGVPIPRGHESEVLERGLLGDPPNPRAFEEDTDADTPVDDNAPFYTKARKPGFKNDDYKDIILNEALQEMRLYMELLPENERRRRHQEPRRGEDGGFGNQPVRGSTQEYESNRRRDDSRRLFFSGGRDGAPAETRMPHHAPLTPPATPSSDPSGRDRTSTGAGCARRGVA